ncbi:sigma-70 family RNA polymerase sigma factor [bacterium]|nr:sigma-70 family RNA polymerase sigma factor [bacterium]
MAVISVDNRYNATEMNELIAKCQLGEREAFDELITRYQRYIFNLIYQHLGSNVDIEDIAQEVFVRIFRFIKKYRGEASFESWVYKIVLNYCRSYARRRSMLNRLFFVPVERDDENRSIDIIDAQAGKENNPMKLIEHQRIANDILDELRKLPAIYKDVLIMREVNELSYEEISEILDISIGTVKSRISRARSMIRDKVKL